MGALLTGPRSRCPRVPSAATRRALLQPATCLGRAPGAPLKTHLETPSDSCRRRRLPTAGAGGGCKGLSFSPLGRLPPLAIGCDKAELKNDAAGQTEVKLAYDHTPHSDEERSPSSLSETARTPWPFSQQVGSVQIQSVLLIIRESAFVLFQKVQFQGHFFFFLWKKETRKILSISLSSRCETN